MPPRRQARWVSRIARPVRKVGRLFSRPTLFGRGGSPSTNVITRGKRVIQYSRVSGIGREAATYWLLPFPGVGPLSLAQRTRAPSSHPPAPTFPPLIDPAHS